MGICNIGFCFLSLRIDFRLLQIQICCHKANHTADIACSRARNHSVLLCWTFITCKYFALSWVRCLGRCFGGSRRKLEKTGENFILMGFIDLCTSPNSIRLSKWRRMRWVGQVAGLGKREFYTGFGWETWRYGNPSHWWDAESWRCWMYLNKCVRKLCTGSHCLLFSATCCLWQRIAST